MPCFRLQTLVDITETQEYRPSNGQIKYRQQQNYQTVINIIGLRANVIPRSNTMETASTTKFGSFYKDKQKTWTFDFDIELENAVSIDMLLNDFDNIPIITGLEETAKIKNDLILTKGQYKNIIFNQIDK